MLNIILKPIMLKKNVFFLLFFFALASTIAFAQAQIQTESIDSVKIKYNLDSELDIPLRPKVQTCGYYKFTPKDTILYTVQSHDSIAIDYGKPLLKARHELLQVVCDSIGKENKHFYLNLRLVAFEADEFELNSKVYTHSNSDWLNRNVYIEIDSVGNRFGLAYDDSTELGLTPGGAFSPILFFAFQEACHDSGGTWTIMQAEDQLVENGLPCPVLRSTYLLTSRGYKDTLGYKTNRIEFIRTSQGSITYSEANKNFRVTSVIASSGILDIGTELKIPIHLFQTMEQKLTIRTNDGVEKPGKQYTSSYFTLSEYKKYKETKTTKKSRKKK